MIGLIVTFIGGVTNIVLDYVFIVVMDMGIKGAALGTGIGFSIPALIGLIYFALNRKGTIYLVKTKFDFSVILKACSNGSSEMITNLSVAVTTILFNITMMKYLGKDGVAAITIVLYSEFLFNAIFLGYSSGVAPLYSYNYGVKDTQKIKKLFRYSIIFIGATSVVIFALVNVLSDDIVGIFVKGNREVFEIALNGMNLFSFGFLFMGSNIFISSLFTALSNGKVSAGLSFIRTFVLISLMIMILPLIFGVNGIWLAVPVAEVIALIVSIICVVKLRDIYLYF